MKGLKFQYTPTRYKIVALLGDEEVGHCTIRVELHDLTIWSMNVAYSYRRKGVATALIRECKRLAKDRKMSLRLRLSSDNVAAYELYKKCGFKAIHGKITMTWKP